MPTTFRSRSMWASLAVAVAAMAATVSLHLELNRELQAQAVDESKQTLPRPAVVAMCSLGYDRFLSDVYWLGVVQYLGEDRPRGKGFVSTYDYFNLITALDPYFEKAYWFGCWAIGYWQQRPDLADAIIRRGMSYSPNDWYLPYIAGVNQNIFACDWKKAADYYNQASKLPGAPAFLARQALILESPVPGLVKQWRTLERIYEDPKTDEQLKESVRPQVLAVLIDMYRYAPTQLIKDEAVKKMQKMGFDTSVLNKR